MLCFTRWGSRKIENLSKFDGQRRIPSSCNYLTSREKGYLLRLFVVRRARRAWPKNEYHPLFRQFFAFGAISIVLLYKNNRQKKYRENTHGHLKGALSWGGDILKNENVAFSEVNFATKNTKNSTWAHSIQLPQRTFLGLGTLPWFALYFKIQTDYFEIVFKKIKKSIVMRSSLYRLFIVHLVTFGVIVKVKKNC